MTLHTTKDGTVIPIGKMTDQHLVNTYRLIKRRVQEGFLHQTGGFSYSTDECWYDEEMVYREEAERLLKLSEYEAEINRRGIRCTPMTNTPTK